MKIDESSIFIGLKKLRKMLYQAQFNMQKADRVIYGTPLMQNCGKALAAFTLALDIREKKIQYLEEAMGYYTIVRTDIEFCSDQNILHFSRKKDQPVSTLKLELFKLVAQIDEDMCEWRASLTKGKLVCD